MTVLPLAYTELRARDRARALLDAGSFREILDPFDRMESPHLAAQGIVGQSDDGAVIARGTIDDADAVILALDGAFQGGGIGEVSGAKLAAGLEQAIADHRAGIPIRVVLLLETGGIRLQEANLGLLAIADIHAAIVELRQLAPVVGVISGPVGCFGGMGIAAGLTSHLVMTREGRLGLNGPEVIETEAGIDELDSADRPLIWSMLGGVQRVGQHLAEILVDDDTHAVAAAVRAVWREPGTPRPRSQRIDAATGILDRLDPAAHLPADIARDWINGDFR
ncbi:biotin-independent malonate decarboxylase subunit beta [Gordonia sp. CPCC 205515]|uniref:biotin-independent malonate decarboxylase subunit beta n=1 Tax=Gordonia sp. CPCC 205515 TaxID=3140791 RepID=UPI003AF3DF5F